MADNKKQQRGGSHEQHVKAGKKGGEATSKEHGPQFYEKIGKKGGQNKGNNK